MSKIDYRHIGKNSERIDARDIVTGKAIFLDDYRGTPTTELLYGHALRCPLPAAKITKIDISKAEALPGVHAVLYYGNMPEMCEGWGMSVPPIVPVLRETAQYVGDAVALVAADTIQIAEAACDLIDIEYEELPHVYHTTEAVKPDAPLVHKEFETNVIPAVPFVGEDMLMHLRRGDPDKAFEECDYVVEGENDYGARGVPMPVEPGGIILHYDQGKLKCWAAAQGVHVTQMSLSGKTNNTPAEVTVFNIGGGFANKGMYLTLSSYAAVLSVATDRPVKFSVTRTGQMLLHERRIGLYMKGKIGIKDGLVHAVKGVCYLDSGSLNGCGQWQMGVGLGECQVAFGKCQNWDIEGQLVMTNKSHSGPVRGFGGQEIKAVLMPLTMQAVRKANIDPLEFFINNFAQTGDGWYWRDQTWYDCREQDYVPAMRATAEKFGWKEKWKGWDKPTRVNGHKAIGVGVSVHGNADVGEDTSIAYVRIDLMRGFVYLHSAIVETGNGQHSNLRKYAAEVLNIPLEKVIFPMTVDTEKTPFDMGVCGSRCTLTTGTAVTRAAEDARRQLLNAASRKLHASPDDLDTRDGYVFYKNRPGVHFTWDAFIEHFGEQITGIGKYSADYSKSNFSIFFAEVEVDLDTGFTKLVKITSGTDVGQIIDPATLEMQAHGGFGAAAIDTGILDESVLDSSTGHTMTSNMIDYKWRTFNDFPPFDFVALESLPEISRFKAVGFGEISGAAGPAAIMMAISNAIGRDFCHYPATPESVLKALKRV
ncbi:MAG: xanthine dehydrogenase family protein molybdopterin-binding subunit [Synergistaceae bacterium]|jgi:xanthine dehydrogenase molybdenum-binding subunit|nr:xanthine dehydrogenase family protein molybdopterin-binding subunit [Synergistaceae bacterium]